MSARFVTVLLSLLLAGPVPESWRAGDRAAREVPSVSARADGTVLVFLPEASAARRVLDSAHRAVHSPSRSRQVSAAGTRFEADDGRPPPPLPPLFRPRRPPPRPVGEDLPSH